MPHKDRVDGNVRSTKPLSYGGTLIEDFSLAFEAGRIVDVRPSRARTVLRELVDHGPRRRAARRDRARAAQLAGLADRACCSTTRCSTRTPRATSRSARPTGSRCKAARAMSDEAFERAGGNRSATHVDFMIGSGELDIDGVLAGGTTEPVMRAGEWAAPIGHGRSRRLPPAAPPSTPSPNAHRPPPAARRPASIPCAPHAERLY